jgi:hypothetical protein
MLMCALVIAVAFTTLVEWWPWSEPARYMGLTAGFVLLACGLYSLVVDIFCGCKNRKKKGPGREQTKKLLLLPIFILILTASSAFAQQPAQFPSLNDRIGSQIGALVLQNAQLAIQMEILQKQLADAQAKIKALEEDKREPKAPPAQ